MRLVLARMPPLWFSDPHTRTILLYAWAWQAKKERKKAEEEARLSALSELKTLVSGAPAPNGTPIHGACLPPAV